MSIKQSIAAFLLLFSVSFSASAGFTGYKQLSNVSATGRLCNMYEGQVLYFTNDLSTYCSGSSSGYDLYGVEITKYGFKLASFGPRPFDTLASLTTVGSCPVGEELNVDTGLCESKCPDGQYPDVEGQCVCDDGSKPNFLGVCDDYCSSEEFKQLKYEKMIMCSNQYGTFSFTCNSRDDVTFECDLDNPTGPDGGSGGSGGDGSGGDGSGGDGSGDVVDAINSMNLDSNTRLDKLIAATKANSPLEKLDTINSSIDSASTQNKQSLDGVNSSIQSLQASNGANTSLITSSLDGVDSSVKKVGGKLDIINDTLSDVNPSSVGKSVCNIGDCISFYTPTYGNGLEGVLTDNFNSMKAVVTHGITDVFNTVDFGGSSKPKYIISLDFGFADYGSYDIFNLAHLDVVFTFLRAFFMACCLFYARSLVFGG
ncbi:hypothetical protein DS893_00055 [Vibrionales bacterium C3R12]|nr:hypothetical protein DS893_00055 [Vibrionales bacterium C3R12]